MPRTVAIAQVLIAVSVLYVWIARLPNVQREFTEYGLPDVVRNLVGVIKTSAATLLLAGFWYPGLVFPAALVMAFFMVSAQVFHFRVKHPLGKYVASFVLLLLSVYVAAMTRGGDV
jgi:hypothetical protein